MQPFDWQLMIAGQPVPAGRNVVVLERWRTVDDIVYIELKCDESNLSETFAVRFNVNIGGKNYLLLEAAQAPVSLYVVARLFGPDKICAMDPDRFSSLKNALASFLEEPKATDIKEFESLLGPLTVK